MSMKNRMFLNCLIALFLASLFARGYAAAASPAIGQAAPDFTLTDSHGESRRLKDFQGKFVVLEWFNNQCPFVRKHYDSAHMQQLQTKYTGQGVVWLSVISSAPGKEGNVTPEEANKNAELDHAKATAVLLDIDGKVGHLYEAKTTPHMFVIDPKGVLIYKGAIDDRPSTDLADIPGGKNYVDQALSEAMSGKPVTTSATKPYGCSVKY